MVRLRAKVARVVLLWLLTWLWPLAGSGQVVLGGYASPSHPAVDYMRITEGRSDDCLLAVQAAVDYLNATVLRETAVTLTVYLMHNACAINGVAADGFATPTAAWVSTNNDDPYLRSIVAHEVGHAVVFQCWTLADISQYDRLRGVGALSALPNTEQFGCNRTAFLYELIAEDFRALFGSSTETPTEMLYEFYESVPPPDEAAREFFLERLEPLIVEARGGE